LIWRSFAITITITINNVKLGRVHLGLVELLSCQLPSGWLVLVTKFQVWALTDQRTRSSHSCLKVKRSVNHVVNILVKCPVVVVVVVLVCDCGACCCCCCRCRGVGITNRIRMPVYIRCWSNALHKFKVRWLAVANCCIINLLPHCAFHRATTVSRLTTGSPHQEAYAA